MKKATYTSKKCGERYNTLLKQSSSGNCNSSFVSPRNLMFGAHKEVSDFDLQQEETPQGQSSYGNLSNTNSKLINSSSSGRGMGSNSP